MARLLAMVWCGVFISSFPASQALAQNYSQAQMSRDECPVVSNTHSYIYHVPGGYFYPRMLIKNKGKDNHRCFKTESAAKAVGFRKSNY